MPVTTWYILVQSYTHVRHNTAENKVGRGQMCAFLHHLLHFLNLRVALHLWKKYATSTQCMLAHVHACTCTLARVRGGTSVGVSYKLQHITPTRSKMRGTARAKILPSCFTYMVKLRGSPFALAGRGRKEFSCAAAFPWRTGLSTTLLQPLRLCHAGIRSMPQHTGPTVHSSGSARARPCRLLC